MFSTPAAFDALEARICTEIVSWRSPRGFGVEAKGFTFAGFGRTPEEAVRKFLINNHLETE